MANTYTYTYITYPIHSNSYTYTITETTSNPYSNEDLLAFDSWWEEYKLAKKSPSSQTVQKPVRTKDIRYINEP